jgi:hypothetical protein
MNIIMIQHSYLYYLVFLWATAAAFAPITNIHTKVRRTTRTLLPLRSRSTAPSDDFARIFGAEEAAERMRENAENFVSQQRKSESLQQETHAAAGGKEAALEDSIDAGVVMNKTKGKYVYQVEEG